MHIRIGAARHGNCLTRNTDRQWRAQKRGDLRDVLGCDQMTDDAAAAQLLKISFERFALARRLSAAAL